VGPRNGYLAVKRLIDVAVAVLGLIVLSPLLVGIAAAILISSGRPVLYRGPRVGKAGVSFRIIKFRTMKIGADRQGDAVTGAADTRVTSIGRRLRRSKLDELPQLINVLIGDMSLVGPRPEHPEFVRLYDSEQRRVLDVRPGLTGAASLRFRSEEEMLTGPNPKDVYVREVMPKKLEIELAYIEHRGLGRDLQILLATLTGREATR